MSKSNSTEPPEGSRLKIVGQPYKRPGQSYRKFVLCECRCGNRKEVNLDKVRSGHTQSCGCLQKERASEAKTTHGHARERTRAYAIWNGMRQRCSNPSQKAYPNYGGRGITVCEKWQNSFEAFLADMGSPPPRMSIERIDNSKNYEPGNCCWATQKQQCRNKRSNRCLEFEGRVQCLAAWAVEYGFTTCALWQRLSYGWTLEKALTTPVRQGRYNQNRVNRLSVSSTSEGVSEMAKFKCTLVKKSAQKRMAASGAKAEGDAWVIRDNEDGSFSVQGQDAAGHPVDITDIAILTVVSSDPTVITVDTPVGMTCATHGLKPGIATLSVTATLNDASAGPFKLDLTGTVGTGPVAGLMATFSNPVPR